MSCWLDTGKCLVSAEFELAALKQIITDKRSCQIANKLSGRPSSKLNYWFVFSPSWIQSLHP